MRKLFGIIKDLFMVVALKHWIDKHTTFLKLAGHWLKFLYYGIIVFRTNWVKEKMGINQNQEILNIIFSWH